MPRLLEPCVVGKIPVKTGLPQSEEWVGWDLRAGKQLTELVGHTGPVTDVEFHPHEFLLASSSEDRSVCLWDLESFSLIGGGGEDGERNGVRSEMGAEVSYNLYKA